jgi:predicted permease
MVQVVNTVVPVFAIILLGWALQFKGFLPSNLIRPLNRLVYYLAIPAMVFREVAKASFETHFNLLLLAATLIPVAIVFVIAVGIGSFYGVPKGHMGTFLQSSFHGNLGYIGLAVAFYLLGERGFTGASILAAFLMVLQNFAAVFGLEAFSPGSGERHRIWFVAVKILGNPVVFSALLGIFFSVTGIRVPELIDRSLQIISGMALPLALLVIGASISFGLIRFHLKLALSSGFLKLVVLPGVGLLIYLWLGIPRSQFLPGLILLASPTATITYVMASEMKGSTDLATAAVSVNTLLSAFTFILWLGLFT